jgi:hypothetical protein
VAKENPHFLSFIFCMHISIDVAAELAANNFFEGFFLHLKKKFT